jgi:hypothetical protein
VRKIEAISTLKKESRYCVRCGNGPLVDADQFDAMNDDSQYAECDGVYNHDLCEWCDHISNKDD